MDPQQIEGLKEQLKSARNMLDICLLVLEHNPTLIHTAVEELAIDIQDMIEEFCVVG